MCYICSCVSSILDAIQRVITFGLACCMFYALCVGMIVASCAGIAYGYNYCMAEFLTLTSRAEVTVFMRRGKFYDPPDIKAPLIHPTGGRRSGDFEEELNANMSSDYDENMRRSSKTLGETWVKSDDTRRYAERLTKFSDSVDSNQVIMVSVHATSTTTTTENSLQTKADDSAKYSDSLVSYNNKINDNDGERPKMPLPSTTIETRYGDHVDNSWKFAQLLSKMDSKDEAGMHANAPMYTTTPDARKYAEINNNNIDNTWKFAEQFSKYGGGQKLVMQNTPTPTTTLDSRNGATVDNSWQFAEQLSKYADESKLNDNVVKVETPEPFFEGTRTPLVSELAPPTRGGGYLNFLKPLRTPDLRKNKMPEDLNNSAKGRVNTRKTTQKRSNSKIKFVERKRQDNKATPTSMRHWVTRASTKAASSEEYSSSEEEDEDIVYRSV